MWEGIVFTGVSRGGGVHDRKMCMAEVCVHGMGAYTCGRRMCVAERGYTGWGGGWHAWWGHAWQEGVVLEECKRVLRILLECFLVTEWNCDIVRVYDICTWPYYHLLINVFRLSCTQISGKDYYVILLTTCR